jgi:hypothetical protein
MLRFTIRDVLWLTALVAVGVFSYVTSQRASRVQQENEALSARAKYAEQLYKDAGKRLVEDSQKLLEIKAEREAAELFWAEAREAKGLPLTNPFERRPQPPAAGN